MGCIVPTGIATDDTTKFFFRDISENGLLVSLFDFENSKGIFPGVHRSYKFCLLTLDGTIEKGREAQFIFFAHDISELLEGDREFTMTASDLGLLNPNTGTCPIFRNRIDAELTKKVYRTVPVLSKNGVADGNPWGITFKQGLFNMTSDSGLFRTKDQLTADGWTLNGNIFEKLADRGV